MRACTQTLALQVRLGEGQVVLVPLCWAQPLGPGLSMHVSCTQVCKCHPECKISSGCVPTCSLGSPIAIGPWVGGGGSGHLPSSSCLWLGGGLGGLGGGRAYTHDLPCTLGACRPCSHAELLLAACTSDFGECPAAGGAWGWPPLCTTGQHVSPQ